MYESRNRWSSPHSVVRQPGGNGSLRQIAPSTLGGNSLPDGSRIRTSYPGDGTVAEPGFTGIGCSPRWFAATAQPVSVCHQWSITATPSFWCAQWYVSGSSRSPARNRTSKGDRSYLASSSPSGSTFLIARSAVGAVNNARTPYSAMTRQNAPASGVPIGLPSYITVVAPTNSGA